MNTKAEQAILHLLRRIQVDPRLAWYFDPATASMEKLTEAHAEAIGVPVEEFRREYYPTLRFERPGAA